MQPISSNRIGLIGIGLLGSAIAQRLSSAGFEISGYDVDGSKREASRSCGIAVYEAWEDIVSACARIFLSLPNSDVVADVLRLIEPRLAPGTVIIDTTTGDPNQVQQAAGRLLARGVFFLDAAIGGSSKQVREGSAIVICGGDANAFAGCHDVFASFSQKTFYVGGAGSGSRMKLVFNLVLGLQRAVLAEGLCFAAANGLDPAAVLEVLKAGPAYSCVMDAKGEKMLSSDFEPQARLSQHLKDVRLILAEGERRSAHLPLSTVHCEILEGLEQAGFGGEDNSAVIRAFRVVS